jgi:hypothetical protein
MLSITQCKKYLDTDFNDNQEIETIRDTYYKLAKVLIDNFLVKSNKEVMN